MLIVGYDCGVHSGTSIGPVTIGLHQMGPNNHFQAQDQAGICAHDQWGG